MHGSNLQQTSSLLLRNDTKLKYVTELTFTIKAIELLNTAYISDRKK